MSDVDAVDARSVRITFTNGERRSYAFAPLETDPSVLGSRFADFMKQGYMVLEKDDSIIVIPMSSILSMEVAPKPGQSLPNTVRILHEFGE